MLRRFQITSLAIFLAGCVAAVLRLRGSGTIEPQTGGWRELTLDDLQ